MEKLNCKSLMIGDWVLYEGEPYQIRQLGIYGEDRDGDDYPAVCVGKPNGIGLILERNEIEPIPITLEILEKIGFVKYIAGQYVLPKMVGEIFVCIMPMEGLPNANGKWLVTIKNGYTDVKIPVTYIHELQHILKLCGIDKEITL